MNHQFIIQQLSVNQDTFSSLLKDVSQEAYLWRPSPDKWCLLEIVCHLHDEEVEDFRARVRHCLENRPGMAPAIDPVAWVSERNYIGQEYNEVVSKFLEARSDSIDWLQSLQDPQWQNSYTHPDVGPRSAELFLANWLAHDYLHFRQITRLKHQYLEAQSGVDLSYAGGW